MMEYAFNVEMELSLEMNKRCKVCGMQFGGGVPMLDIDIHLNTHIKNDELWEEIQE